MAAKSRRTGNLAIIQLSTFQNRNGSGVSFRVAQTQMNDPPAALFQKFLPIVMQNYKGLTALVMLHFHVLPAELTPNACAEGFGDSFLGGEPGREKRRGILVGQAIGNFIRSQYAFEKSLAESFMGSLDASDFNDVNASAENHFGFATYDLRAEARKQASFELQFLNAARQSSLVPFFPGARKSQIVQPG